MRSSWKVGGGHRKSRGQRSACTRTHFSGLRFGTPSENGIKIRENTVFLLTFQKDRNCEVCLRTNMTRAPCRRDTGNDVPRSEKFGEYITENHKVLSEDGESRNYHRTLSLFKILLLIGFNPIRAKQRLHKRRKSLRKFLEPSQKPKVIYTDNFIGIGTIFWRSIMVIEPQHKWYYWKSHKTSERRKLQQFCYSPGLDERWWADSVECCCYLRIVEDVLAEGKTPYERRCGEPNTSKGAVVQCHPISTRDFSRLHQYGKKVVLRIFLGYELMAGGIWKGNILIADLERFGKVGRIRKLSSKNQLERSIDITKRVQITFCFCDGSRNFRKLCTDWIESNE